MNCQELDRTEQLTHTEGVILDLRGGKRTPALWLFEEVVWPPGCSVPGQSSPCLCAILTLQQEHTLSGCPPPRDPCLSDALPAPQLLPSRGPGAQGIISSVCLHPLPQWPWPTFSTCCYMMTFTFMSSAQTSANSRCYLVDPLVGNGLESELNMCQAQVLITHHSAMWKMRLCVMKWGFINVALVLVSQGWEGWGGASVKSVWSSKTTKGCVFKDQLRATQCHTAPATRLCAGVSCCMALLASGGCWQDPLMCAQSLVPGGLLGNVPFCTALRTELQRHSWEPMDHLSVPTGAQQTLLCCFSLPWPWGFSITTLEATLAWGALALPQPSYGLGLWNGGAGELWASLGHNPLSPTHPPPAEAAPHGALCFSQSSYHRL